MGLGSQLLQAIREAQANQPSLGAELKAMAREAVKDVRATAHEVYFGQAEHAPEQGTPLNPTSRENYEQRHDITKDEPDLDMA